MFLFIRFLWYPLKAYLDLLNRDMIASAPWEHNSEAVSSFLKSWKKVRKIGIRRSMTASAVLLLSTFRCQNSVPLARRPQRATNLPSEYVLFFIRSDSELSGKCYFSDYAVSPDRPHNYNDISTEWFNSTR